MASGRFLQVSKSVGFVVAALAFLGAATRVAAQERARVSAGDEGLVGSWRLVRATSSPLTSLCDEAPPACPAAELLVSDDGELPLEDVPGAPSELLLALRIAVSGAGREAHLFVGGVGAYGVLLDGQELARGATTEWRADDLHVLLPLPPGEHIVAIHAVRPAHGPWRLQARALDGDFGPGFGAGVEASLGRLDAALSAAAALRSVRVTEARVVRGDGALAVEASVARPAGGVDVALSAGVGADVRALTGSALRFEVAAPARGDVRDVLRLGATGGPPRDVAIGHGLALDRPLASVIAALRAALSTVSAASHAPLAWRLDELERVLRDRDPDALWRRTLVSDVRALLAQFARGRDPLAAPLGYVRMALRSRLDGALVPYELFVPTEHARGARRLPLLVTLHGFTGNAGDYFRNTFGLSREPRATLEQHGRHGAVPTSAPMIVVAPTGRGQTHYRYAGEEDVLEVLADVRARYRVDDERIYVTGGSMGGTGAAYLPFRHPDLFAASAALAGYHDQRVRQDTAQSALAPWEQFLRAERSDVDWAENALHLPMLLVRGTRDRPLAWTTSLATRLAELGYCVEHRQPESGHNVWTETYAAGALFRWLAPHRRPIAPSRVRFRTGRARYASAWWVQRVVRARRDQFAEIDATVRSAAAQHQVRATTQNVSSLVLAPGVVGERVHAQIDDDLVDGLTPLSLVRDAAHWREARPPAAPSAVRSASDAPSGARDATSRADAARDVGPIRDVFHDPLLFVVGTADPRHTLINRLVARAWARPRGWQVAYPIVDDVTVTDAQLRSHTLVLVGPPASNRILARVASQLPVRFEGDALRFAGHTHRGAEVGAVFVAESPLDPTQRLLVIAGIHPLGTWRSLFLPDLLPDLVVFDEHIAAARDHFAAGGTGATLREASFGPFAPARSDAPIRPAR